MWLDVAGRRKGQSLNMHQQLSRGHKSMKSLTPSQRQELEMALILFRFDPATPLLRPRLAIYKDDGLKIENTEFFYGPIHPHRLSSQPLTDTNEIGIGASPLSLKWSIYW